MPLAFHSLPACPHTAFTSPRPVCDALALTRPRPCETTLAFASPRQLTSSPSPSGPHTSSASTSNIITSSPPPALMPRLVSLNCILAPHPSLRPCLPSPPLTSPLPCIAIRPSTLWTAIASRMLPHRRGPGLRVVDLSFCRTFAQICSPSTLRSSDEPSVGIGLRSDLGAGALEVTTKPVSEGLFALELQLSCRAASRAHGNDSSAG